MQFSVSSSNNKNGTNINYMEKRLLTEVDAHDTIQPQLGNRRSKVTESV
jgi:hypothetical protein